MKQIKVVAPSASQQLQEAIRNYALENMALFEQEGHPVPSIMELLGVDEKQSEAIAQACAIHQKELFGEHETLNVPALRKMVEEADNPLLLLVCLEVARQSFVTDSDIASTFPSLVIALLNGLHLINGDPRFVMARQTLNMDEIIKLAGLVWDAYEKPNMRCDVNVESPSKHKPKAEEQQQEAMQKPQRPGNPEMN